MTRCCRDSIYLKSSAYNQTGQSYVEQLSIHRSMCAHLRRILQAKSLVDSRNPRFEKAMQRRSRPPTARLKYLDCIPSDETIDKLAYDTEHHPADLIKITCRSKSSSAERSGSQDRRPEINETACLCGRSSAEQDCCLPSQTAKPTPRKKLEDVYDCRIQCTKKTDELFSNPKASSTPSSTRSRRYMHEANEPQVQQQRSTSLPPGQQQQQQQQQQKQQYTSCPITAAGGRECDESCLKAGREEEEARYAKFVYDITQEIVQNGLYTDRELKEVFDKHLERNSGCLNKRKMLYEIYQLKISLNVCDSTDSEEDEVEADLVFAEKFVSHRVPKPPTPPKVLNENKVIEKLHSFQSADVTEYNSAASSPRRLSLGSRNVTLVDANPEFLVTERDFLSTLADHDVDPAQIQKIYKHLVQKSKDMTLCEAVQVGSEVAYAHRLKKIDRCSSAISLGSAFTRDGTKSPGILRKDSKNYDSKIGSPQLQAEFRHSFLTCKQSEALEKCERWKSIQCHCKLQPCMEHASSADRRSALKIPTPIPLILAAEEARTHRLSRVSIQLEPRSQRSSKTISIEESPDKSWRSSKSPSEEEPKSQRSSKSSRSCEEGVRSHRTSTSTYEEQPRFRRSSKIILEDDIPSSQRSSKTTSSEEKSKSSKTASSEEEARSQDLKSQKSSKSSSDREEPRSYKSSKSSSGLEEPKSTSKTTSPEEPRSQKSSRFPTPEEPRSQKSSKTPSPEEPRSQKSSKTPSPEEPRSLKSSKTVSPEEPRSRRSSKIATPEEPRSQKSSKTATPEEPRSLRASKTAAFQEEEPKSQRPSRATNNGDPVSKITRFKAKSASPSPYSELSMITAQDSARSQRSEDEEIEEEIESDYEESPRRSKRSSASNKYDNRHDEDEKDLSSVPEEDEGEDEDRGKSEGEGEYSDDFSNVSDASSKNVGATSRTDDESNISKVSPRRRYSTVKEYFDKFSKVDQDKVYKVSDASSDSTSQTSGPSYATTTDAASRVVNRPDEDEEDEEEDEDGENRPSQGRERAFSVQKKKRASSGASGLKVVGTWNERLSELSSEFYARGSVSKYCDPKCRRGSKSCGDHCRFLRTNCRNLSKPTDCLIKVKDKSDESSDSSSS